MSVFRFELVGPNFQLKRVFKNLVKQILKKGKLVNIPVLFDTKKFFKEVTLFGFILWLIVKLNKLIVFF